MAAMGQAPAMHELSVAYNIVEIAAGAARDAGVTQVGTVHLRLGAMSGVEQEPLRFGYGIAIEGTCLAGSRLVIEDVPLTIFCPTCGTERVVENVQVLRCPACGTPSMDIRSGRELEIAYLEYDDESANP